MSYASRPMGDYKTYGYAGDPGWLSGLWKGVKKFILPAAGMLIGGPIGAVIGGVTSGGGKPLPPVMAAQPGTLGGAIAFPGGTTVSGAFQPGAIVPGRGRLPPFTAAGAGVLPGGGRGGACPAAGYHWAKDGSGRMVRNRRMNVANPRAARRAMRRMQGFEKLAKRVINFNKRVRPARKSS